jgi:hypothetical protein
MIDADDSAVTRRIVQARADAFTQPRIARHYRTLLLDAGFLDTSTEVRTGVFTGSLMLPMLTGFAYTARAVGAVTDQQAEHRPDEQRRRHTGNHFREAPRKHPVVLNPDSRWSYAGAMTGGAFSASPAAAWPRRLVILLAVLAALLAVRAPVCTGSMATGMSAPPGSSMEMAGGPVRTWSAQIGGASTPAGLCATPAAGGAADPAWCLQAPPTAINVTGVVGLAAAEPVGYLIAVRPAPAVVAAPVLRHAATLHQLGLLRT